jgi:hypothetical protein
MKKGGLLGLVITFLFLLTACGCVERRLTINTEPQGALVILNDEQIGISPVTASFNWYGDYNITIRKDGFETLKTHRELKAPWYDAFPFDFFAQILIPGRTVDSYEWTFELAEKEQISRDELLQQARQFEERLQ